MLCRPLLDPVPFPNTVYSLALARPVTTPGIWSSTPQQCCNHSSKKPLAAVPESPLSSAELLQLKPWMLQDLCRGATGVTPTMWAKREFEASGTAQTMWVVMESELQVTCLHSTPIKDRSGQGWLKWDIDIGIPGPSNRRVFET